ncbi:homeobox domain protein [Dictyocaulus viviparus]|uniref:Homeobox domain protein n=1 Tax=Dictyocaulus viviparus TaxID=29172 RepID=A0A0D8XB21_DICVI|nr:homeobox domain protein [Dictyocaulus viviparus]
MKATVKTYNYISDQILQDIYIFGPFGSVVVPIGKRARMGGVNEKATKMLSMASVGSAFKPYYRPDHLLTSTHESKQSEKLYSDPEPAMSSPIENNNNNGKNRRKRTTFTQYQATILEKEYLSERYMVRDKRSQLAESLGLSEAQVKTWFQNRRAKDKREKKFESPQRSPFDSTNPSINEDSALDNNQSSMVSPSVSAEHVVTPPPQLQPATSPIIKNHQILSGILQAGPLPEHQRYYANMAMTTIDPTPSSNTANIQKTDTFCTDTAVKDIYNLPVNIYDPTFCSLYNHIPININSMTSSHESSFIPEPLAPIANNESVGVEHHQLTAL